MDPVTMAVVKHSLISVTTEMRQVFKRTSMLPILYAMNDFGVSLYDSRLNLVADAPGIPIFVGSLDVCLERTLEEIGGPEELAPGDILLNNHPYLTAGQPADAVLMMPVFDENGIIAYAALRGHMGDLGAMRPYPTDTTELFQEGTIFPGVKLYEEGRLRDDIVRIVGANSRLPIETTGSVLAGSSSVRAGAERLKAIVDRYGRDTYFETVDEILRQGESLARARLSEIPDGSYELVDYLDNNGVDSEPVELRCVVTVEGSDVTIDLRGSAPEQNGPMNCPWGYTLTTCRFALKRIVADDTPASSGETRPLTVLADEGSIFDPRPPAACFIGAWTSIRLGDMIIEALAPALTDVIPACNGGDLVTTLAYLNKPNGRVEFFADIGMLGHGAIKGADGMNALIHPIEAGCEIIPTEVLETRMPIRKRRFELITDSGGSGEFRGGLSALGEFEFLAAGLSTSVVERSQASESRGVNGGDAAPFQNRMILFPGTEKELQLGKKPDVPVAAGDICISRPSGGGGWGLAVERDPAMVANDVRNGYVSREKAEELYGVVLNANGGVDMSRTEELRATITDTETGRVEAGV